MKLGNGIFLLIVAIILGLLLSVQKCSVMCDEGYYTFLSASWLVDLGIGILGILLIALGIRQRNKINRIKKEHLTKDIQTLQEKVKDLEKDKVDNILQERYAKGEITKEDFDKMKEDLA